MDREELDYHRRISAIKRAHPEKARNLANEFAYRLAARDEGIRGIFSSIFQITETEDGARTPPIKLSYNEGEKNEKVEVSRVGEPGTEHFFVTFFADEEASKLEENYPYSRIIGSIATYGEYIGEAESDTYGPQLQTTRAVYDLEVLWSSMRTIETTQRWIMESLCDSSLNPEFSEAAHGIEQT